MPVGAERHTDHRPVWPVSGVAEGLAGVGVPQPHRAVSKLAEAIRCPSGLNATLVHRAGVAGERGAEGLAGVGVPQPHRLVALAEAIRCPSGLNATPITRSVWPVSGSPRGWPVSAFHSRTVSSKLAEAIRCRRG